MKKRGLTAPPKSIKGVRAQVTIFIIIGILLVSAILTYFLWAKPTFITEKSGSLGLENCVEDALEQGIEQLGPTAGFIEPEFTYMHQGEEVQYLCYTSEYYIPCTIQKSLLVKHFEDQLNNLLFEKINTCYANSISSLVSQGYEVIPGEVTYNTKLDIGTAKIELEAPTKVGSSKFERFIVELNSPIYELITITTSILKLEAKYGNSDTDYFAILYPDYIVEKSEQGEGTKIYTITSKIFQNKFKFASRSLVFPPGFNPNN